jgi:hypothetical protein
MLKLDLMRLETPQRFQALCTRLVRREFPDALPTNFASWDGGRDILRLDELIDGKLVHHAVWQAKFTNRLDAATKRAIAESISTITRNAAIKVKRWILCLPVDPTGHFLDWLAREVARAGWTPEVWGSSVLLEKLEHQSDLIENFFWADFEELRRHFRADDLELLELHLDESCQWEQRDRKVLAFSSTENVDSPDLVLDVIVRNVGTVDGVIVGLVVDFVEWECNPHGYPGTGLLFPQVTYAVSINRGRPGTYTARCEPPLIIRGGSVERFKIRLCDTGYAWRGTIVVSLDYGRGRTLRLPAMRIYT